MSEQRDAAVREAWVVRPPGMKVSAFDRELAADWNTKPGTIYTTRKRLGLMKSTKLPRARPEAAAPEPPPIDIREGDDRLDIIARAWRSRPTGERSSSFDTRLGEAFGCSKNTIAKLRAKRGLRDRR